MESLRSLSSILGGLASREVYNIEFLTVGVPRPCTSQNCTVDSMRAPLERTIRGDSKPKDQSGVPPTFAKVLCAH